jgi:hypothetical protein
VLNEALLVKEEINVGWVFVGKTDFENVATMHERPNKCKIMLEKTMDYQLHLLAVKLNREYDIDDDKKMASTPNIKQEGTTPARVLQILQPMHLHIRGLC